jgi:hypothetical protein
MSITDIATRLQVSDLAKGRELKTLMVDIERLPGRATVEWGGVTITGDFWDLSGWKHVIRRRIQPEEVHEWPWTICATAMWYGSKRPNFFAAWDEGGTDAMHAGLFDLYDEADMAITYNGVGFDEKHLRSGWAERDMGRPSPWRPIDLYKVVRQAHGWESKKLSAVCDRLNIPAKNDKYEVEMARAAVAGSASAQRRLRSYNVNDVKILAAAYEKLMPDIKGHPHVAPVRGEDANLCPRCGSEDVERDGTYSPGVYHYRAYKCRTCKGSYRTTFDSRGPSVRAL